MVAGEGCGLAGRATVVDFALSVVAAASAAAGCGAEDPDAFSSQAGPSGVDTTWRTVDHLYHKTRTHPDKGEWGDRVSYPDKADLPGERCGPECGSNRHSLVTCPGIHYSDVDGIEKVGGFLRRTNGSESGAETGLHVGFFFYTCDDFCGKKEGACAPGENRESEYGIKINVATNKFNFYQSYDSNNCGARHRVDNLNGNFDPSMRHGTFRVLVRPDGSYRVRQYDPEGRLMASQSITNCTMEHDCKVLCGGGKDACDGPCPVDCRAKHSDSVNLYQAGGKVNVHTMKKQGPAYIYWSEASSAGNASTNLADLVRVRTSARGQGECALADELADSDPTSWAEEGGDESSASACVPVTCDSLGQICGA